MSANYQVATFALLIGINPKRSVCIRPVPAVAYGQRSALMQEARLANHAASTGSPKSSGDKTASFEIAVCGGCKIRNDTGIMYAASAINQVTAGRTPESNARCPHNMPKQIGNAISE